MSGPGAALAFWPIVAALRFLQRPARGHVISAVKQLVKLAFDYGRTLLSRRPPMQLPMLCLLEELDGRAVTSG